MTCGKSVVSSFNIAERGPRFNGNIVESGVKDHTHLRFSDSEFPFGIFKLFLNCNFLRFPILKRFHCLVCIEWRYRYIESNTGKSARQGNLRQQRVSEISLSLSCTFRSVWFYFSLFSAVFSSVFVWHVLLARRSSCKQWELFPFHVNQKCFLCIAWRLLCNNMADC